MLRRSLRGCPISAPKACEGVMISTDALKYLPQMGLDPSRVVGCAAAKCQNSFALANGFAVEAIVAEKFSIAFFCSAGCISTRSHRTVLRGRDETAGNSRFEAMSDEPQYRQQPPPCHRARESRRCRQPPTLAQVQPQSPAQCVVVNRPAGSIRNHNPNPAALSTVLRCSSVGSNFGMPPACFCSSP